MEIERHSVRPDDDVDLNLVDQPGEEVNADDLVWKYYLPKPVQVISIVVVVDL